MMDRPGRVAPRFPRDAEARVAQRITRESEDPGGIVPPCLGGVRRRSVVS
jgi:hypothetical protein